MTKYIRTQKKCKKRIESQSLKNFSHFPPRGGSPVGGQFLIIIGLAILSFVGFYVWLVTENAVKSYEIRDLQAKTEELQNVNRGLEVASAESQSAISLNSKIKILGMETTDRVDYVILQDKVMVKR